MSSSCDDEIIVFNSNCVKTGKKGTILMIIMIMDKNAIKGGLKNVVLSYF